MEPVKFDECNGHFAASQDEYITLPALICTDYYGTTIFCWKLTWKDKLKLLFTGKIWHTVLTMNNELQPVKLDVTKPKLMRVDNTVDEHEENHA